MTDTNETFDYTEVPDNFTDEESSTSTEENIEGGSTETISILDEEEDIEDSETSTSEESNSQETKDSEYPILESINESIFNGGLDLNKIEAESEVDIIKGLFEEVISTADNKEAEYLYIEKLLEDPEVKNFLEFKSQGKNLNDLVYSLGTSGLDTSPEGTVLRHVKSQYPNMSTDQVNSIIQGYHDGGTFEAIAEQLKQREDSNNLEELENQNRQEQEARDARESWEQSYADFLTETSSVMDIKLDDVKRNRIFALATEVNQDTGNLYIYEALQSPELLLRASIGMLYMEELKHQVVDKPKTIVDKMLRDPSQLKKTKKTRKTVNTELDLNALNKF